MRAEERPAEGLGIGSEAEQVARLEHAQERHGLEPELCPACAGQNDFCGRCGGWGLLWTPGDLAPCGPSCPLQVLRTPS